MSNGYRCPRCGSLKVSKHMETVPAQSEADRWSPTREIDYRCDECRLMETKQTDEEGYKEFRLRWNDPVIVLTPQQHQAMIEENLRIDEERARAWTWPPEHYASTREQRAEALAESRDHDSDELLVAKEAGETLPKYKYGYPVGEEYVAPVLRDPDDDTARWNYASWLRQYDNEAAQSSASFIEWQLRLAESYRSDPRSDIKQQLPEGVFHYRDSKDLRKPWYRYPGVDTKFGEVPGLGWRGLGESTGVLESYEIVARQEFYRGFVEHVAIKAARFLEIADELYSLAPIRHLTLTYCKGLDHRDVGLWKALLESPHLDRIRSLQLPVQVATNEYTELNRLTDEDIELLGSSTHLHGLAYLSLNDQQQLTIRAFDALATSPRLPALSAVQHDLYRYAYQAAFTFGNFGDRVRYLLSQPLKAYAPALEARHGQIAWLHPEENYGAEDPDVEAVVEHPVSLRKKG